MAKFGEGLKRENSTKEGYDCHRKDGDGLLLQQAFIARVHVDVGAHCQMQIYLESSCSVCHNVVRISRISVAMLSGHGGVKWPQNSFISPTIPIISSLQSNVFIVTDLWLLCREKGGREMSFKWLGTTTQSRSWLRRLSLVATLPQTLSPHSYKFYHSDEV